MNYKHIVLGVILAVFLPYNYWIYINGTPDVKISESAHRGKEIWFNLNCHSCHQIYGLGGYMGPDLTNVISNKGVNHTRAMIQVGTVRMPKFTLTDSQIADIIQYLTAVDKSGKYPLKKYQISFNGMVYRLEK